MKQLGPRLTAQTDSNRAAFFHWSSFKKSLKTLLEVAFIFFRKTTTTTQSYD